MLEGVLRTESHELAFNLVSNKIQLLYHLKNLYPTSLYVGTLGRTDIQITVSNITTPKCVHNVHKKA